ncbi:MAG: hypothetical protein QXX20_00155 [Candidatus Thermoplasmatota archaeon]
MKSETMNDMWQKCQRPAGLALSPASHVVVNRQQHTLLIYSETRED